MKLLMICSMMSGRVDAGVERLNVMGNGSYLLKRPPGLLHLVGGLLISATSTLR